MPRLLVYSALDRRPHALLQELDASDEIDFTWTTDLELLEAGLARGHHNLCLLLLRGEPTAELSAVLARARGLQLLQGAVSVHTLPSAEGIRTMLKLGVREVFLEPVAPRRIVQALKLRLQEAAGPVVATGVLQERPPAPCEVRSYGRVLRLSVLRPGALLVRTNVVLEAGAEVVLTGPLMRALGVERARFHAVSRDDTSAGDGYAAAWWLDQPIEPAVVAGWPAVLARLHAIGEEVDVPRDIPPSRCSFLFPGRLVAVSALGFEVATRARVQEDSLVELVGLDVGPRRALGFYGRFIDARHTDDAHVGRLRCEVLPISDDPHLSLVRGPHALEEPMLAPAAPAPVRRPFSPVWIAAAVAVALVLAFLLAAGPLTGPTDAGDVASTQAVFAAIRQAFK